MASQIILWLILAIIVALALVFLAYRFKENKNPRKINYKHYLSIGLIFIAVGVISTLFYHTIYIFWLLGIIYTIIGAYGKYWLKGKQPTEKAKKIMIVMGILIIILSILLFELIARGAI